MRGIKTTTISILAIGLLAGSAVGVAAQDEEADPMGVNFIQKRTGSEIFDLSDRCDPRPEADADLTQAFYQCQGYWEAKDPRLSGLWYLLAPSFTPAADGRDVLSFEDAENPREKIAVERQRVAVTNEDGRWVGVITVLDTSEARQLALERAKNKRQRQRIERDWMATPETLVLDGQGAYDGLTALAYLDSTETFTALIFPGEMPPLVGDGPEPLEPATE